ncbi:hypothetical protein RAC69_03995 [Microbacterium sp. LS_15]|uniref:hypothetical protein n=1 Tax=Microbacterium sp. LS_15 TaxID=3055790 RepID=UPI0035BFAB08
MVGATAAVIGTVALHLFFFGDDEYFPLRFLLSPVSSPVSFAAFLLSLVFLGVAIVQATRTGAWAEIRGGRPQAHGAGAGTDDGAPRVVVADAGARTEADADAEAGASARTDPDRGAHVGSGAGAAVGAAGRTHVGEKPLPGVAVPGAVTRRAVRSAAIVSVVNALFLMVFPIAMIPIFAVIFVIALALIAASHIVLVSTIAPSPRA